MRGQRLCVAAVIGQGRCTARGLRGQGFVLDLIF